MSDCILADCFGITWARSRYGLRCIGFPAAEGPDPVSNILWYDDYAYRCAAALGYGSGRGALTRFIADRDAGRYLPASAGNLLAHLHAIGAQNAGEAGIQRHTVADGTADEAAKYQ